ncbi:MAG TPA: hypothetical protein VEC57_05950 [Candidatus Limnocylindrales bacterium]|nr:hypothetical protein [Candidatus Limnocylindrales bacterium]
MDARTTANMLGLTGIGIGLTEIAAPVFVEKSLGIGHRHVLMRAMGLREIASGVAILTQDKPAAGMWSRVAGDALDLALLGAAAIKSNRKAFVFGAIAAVMAIAYLDYRNATELSR